MGGGGTRQFNLFLFYCDNNIKSFAIFGSRQYFYLRVLKCFSEIVYNTSVSGLVSIVLTESILGW